jgi:hypothetical protein
MGQPSPTRSSRRSASTVRSSSGCFGSLKLSEGERGLGERQEHVRPGRPPWSLGPWRVGGSSRGPTADEHDDDHQLVPDRLTAPAVPRTREWDPVTIGPTWQTHRRRALAAARATLGWEVLGWCGRWLQHGRRRPWRFTDEQARFCCGGTRSTRRAVRLPRRRPAAAQGLGQGPARRVPLRGRDARPGPVRRLGHRRPRSRPTSRRLGADGGRQRSSRRRTRCGSSRAVHGRGPRRTTGPDRQGDRPRLGGERLIQAVTSSPATLEGARATFVLRTRRSTGTRRTKATRWPTSSSATRRSPRRRGAHAAHHQRLRARRGLGRPAGPRGVGGDRSRRSLDDRPAVRLARGAAEAPLTAEAARRSSTRSAATRLARHQTHRQSILDPRNPPSRRGGSGTTRSPPPRTRGCRPRSGTPTPTRRRRAEKAIVTLGFDGSKSDDHSP